MRLVVLLIALLTIGCDQVTKRLAVAHLAGTARHSYLADTLRLEYSENTGAFLGAGAQWPEVVRVAVFTLGTGLVLLALGAALVRGRWSPVQRLGLVLLWAGGISNLADRALHGRVVDFLNVGVAGLRTGIFNVADVAILFGVALALVTAKRPRTT
jgi:signal peptidase II